MKLKKITAAAAGTVLLLLAFAPAAGALHALFGDDGRLEGASAAVQTDEAKSGTDAAIPGDVSLDGHVTAEDARLCLRRAVGLETYAMGSARFCACDMNGDNAITAADARLILRAVVGLPLTEPETEPTTEPETEPATEPTTEPATEPTTAPVPVTVPVTEPKTTAPDVPRTSKGYEIKTVNGITYVGGLMIANKTYALPSNYAPGRLTAETEAAFARMQKDAARQGLNLYVSSGYRSYELQKSLYNRYAARDGKAAADRYSARPGHSEHQTGLAFDLNTITQSFANTAEGKWVAKNCWRYGFILRYPQGKEDKTGYMYEPWHLRYIGEDMAKQVYDSGLCLEEFLGITSYYH